jgi:tripartite-type tricarboxylate transporter receptor subunit TctC
MGADWTAGLIGRGALALGALALLSVSRGALPAQAEPYPTKPVKIVIPYPISGPTDIRGTPRMSRSYRLMAPHAPPAVTDTLARIAERAIRADTTHPVELARRPGAATSRGALAVARSAADGHTLLLASNATMILNPHYFHGVEYDPVRDFILVAPLATMPFVLLAHAGLAADDARALAAWLKVRPGEINFGSSGDGSTGHLAGELFRRMAGVSVVHVSYNSGVDALNGLARRQVSFMFGALPLTLNYSPSEHFAPLAVTSARRLERLPEVPTMAESGYPACEIEAWYGLFTRAGAPPVATAWLRTQLSALFGSTAIQSYLRGIGLEPATMTLEQFATRIHTEFDRWGPLLRASRLPKDQDGRMKDEG